jgi:Two component regulator propeller
MIRHVLPLRDSVSNFFSTGVGGSIRIGELPTGTFIVQTTAGIFTYDGMTFVKSHLLPDSLDKAQSLDRLLVFNDRNGITWLNILGYKVRLTREQKILSITPSENKRYVSFYQDTEDNLWLGAYYGGLQMLNNGKFICFGKEEGLADISFDVCGSRDSVMFAATDNGLFRMERMDNPVLAGARGTSPTALFDFRITNVLPNKVVRSVLRDRTGRIWAATTGGVFSGDGRELTAQIGTNEGLTNDNARLLYEDRSGTIWVGTREGLNVIRDGVVVPLKDYFSDSVAAILRKFYVTSCMQDSEGKMWIGTSGLGLWRLSGSGHSASFRRQTDYRLERLFFRSWRRNRACIGCSQVRVCLPLSVTASLRWVKARRRLRGLCFQCWWIKVDIAGSRPTTASCTFTRTNSCAV